MKNIIFVCSQNKLRSATAEQVFANVPGMEVMSAGLNHDAVYTLSSEDVEWADTIFVMEKAHKNKLLKKFKKFIKDQRIIVLGIPDDYEYMDPQLIKILKQKLATYDSAFANIL